MARSLGRAWPVVGMVLLAGCLGAGGAAKGAPAGLGRGAEPAALDAVCHDSVHGIDLQQATILDLQAALSSGRLTSVQLVQAYLDRIAAFDPHTAVPGDNRPLNAVRALNPHALDEAATLDAERATGHVRGPMHGIPVLLKDNVGTNDLPTTAGSIALELNVPPQDATIAARLRDAGAIILGKLNLSEFANWVSSTMPSGYSSLGGQVVNAYTGGNPSGSSSGSGVAASMAFAAATIGTETSGSILSPSNANSVVGVKPTMGLNSRFGIIPLAANFDVPGPMVRHVSDAAVMLGAIAGPDPLDPVTSQSRDRLPPGNDFTLGLSTHALAGARLGYQASSNALFTQALEDLKAQGAILVPLQTNPLTGASSLEGVVIYNEFKWGINDYLAHLAGPRTPVKDLTDIILFNNDHPDRVKYGQDELIVSDAQTGLQPQAQYAGLPVVLASRAAADKLFSDNNVDTIIGPNAPYTGLGAAAGYPTVTVPSGYSGKTPVGLSFFGPAFSEPKLLGYAYAYEQATQRRVPPTVMNPALREGLCPSTAEPGAAAPAATFRHESFVEAT